MYFRIFVVMQKKIESIYVISVDGKVFEDTFLTCAGIQSTFRGLDYRKMLTSLKANSIYCQLVQDTMSSQVIIVNRCFVVRSENKGNTENFNPTLAQ